MRAWIVAVLSCCLTAHAAADTLFEQIAGQAQRLAAEGYDDAANALPESLQSLDYAAYRDIRFRKDHALWRDAADFNVEFFHPGFLYRQPVTVYEVDGDQVTRVAFDSNQFDYGKNYRLVDLPADLGFAGFRVHFPLQSETYKDELIAFLGAAYFRMVGRGQHYGLSARGLAVNTALPSGEEFPRFKAFWLVRPEPRASHLRFYALLDSPSVTGAYAFELQSGGDTLLDVEARLFARRDVERLGVAPLTSMFAWGENGVRGVDDYRPEVHDSDGLLQHNGAGEWIWRPLVNPPNLQVSALLDSAPQGFGLIQRDRDFDHYQDAEARYDRRPGLWVVPGEGDWGKGSVQLVEIPTPDETNDNVVAYWVSDVPFKAGESRHFAYRLSTVGERVPGLDVARVVASRNGWGWVPGSHNRPPSSLRQFVIDFAGGELTGLGGDQPLEAELSVRDGTARHVTVSRLPDRDVWRVAFKLLPAGREQRVDMRLFLTLRDRRVSETWSYLWDPESVQAS